MSQTSNLQSPTGSYNKRAALYHAHLASPQDAQIRKAFRALHSHRHYLKAAKRGAFLCYTNADDIFAIELAEHLKGRDYPVWIDMLDVADDEDWHDAIHMAIKRAGVMLLVLSPDAVRSDDVQKELSQFLEMGKMVLPILHRGCNPTRLNLVHPVIDFRENHETALHKLEKVLGITDR